MYQVHTYILNYIATHVTKALNPSFNGILRDISGIIIFGIVTPKPASLYVASRQVVKVYLFTSLKLVN